jgi:hypothetical protein
LLAYGVVTFLHGGSPFMVWQPDSFRIRLNRRSTFNYGWDILAVIGGEQSVDSSLFSAGQMKSIEGSMAELLKNIGTLKRIIGQYDPLCG